MSLNKLISHPDVMLRFKRSVKLPTLPEPAPPLLIQPDPLQSYLLVEGAFNYCLRFWLAAHYRDLAIEQPWIAEIGLEEMAAQKETQPSGVPLELAAKGVRRSRELYAEYLEQKTFTRQLVRAALYVAAIDRFYRAGPNSVYIHWLRNTLTVETDDCLALLEAAESAMMVPKARVVLNPSFGKASALVGGADADLIIDDTLIEVTTKMSYEISIVEVSQLIGYLILLGACGGKGSIACGEPRITHGAIYFARHARLVRFSFEDVIESQSLSKLGEWLLSYAPTCHLTKARDVGLSLRPI